MKIKSKKKSHSKRWLLSLFSFFSVALTACASTSNAVTPSNNNSNSSLNTNQPTNPTEPIQPAPEQKPPETTKQPTNPEPSPPTEVANPPTAPKEPEESIPAKPSDSSSPNPPAENSTDQPPNPNSSETDSDKNDEPQKPETPNAITEENGVKIYQKYSDFVKQNLGFNHQNFFVKNDGSHYIKTYRLHQNLDQEYWKFNQATQEFNWSVSKALIENVLNSDSSATDVKLWLFLDIRESKKEIDGMQTPLKDYEHFQTFYRTGQSTLKYGVGLEIPWSQLLEQNNLVVSETKYTQITTSYDDQKQTINFQIQKKPGVSLSFTDNYLKALKYNEIYFSNFNNFLNLSFQSSNNVNQTLGTYQEPKQYEKFNYNQWLSDNQSNTRFLDKASLYDPADPWKTNVNAYDKSTRERLSFSQFNQKKHENTYIDNMDQVAPYNDFKLADEMRIRTFKAGDYSETGTFTMFAKVKPSDPNDHRYYVMTNYHVTATGKGTVFSKISNKNFLDAKKIIMHPPTVISNSNMIKSFWAPTRFTNIFNQVAQKPKDIAVGIIDTSFVINAIEKTLAGNNPYDSTEVANWKASIEDLKAWASLKPLHFTNKYSNLFSYESSGLVDWFINGYSSRSYVNYKINRINFQTTKRLSSSTNPVGRFTNDFSFNPSPSDTSLLFRGASGSLIVDSERNVAGIYWGRESGLHAGQIFYSSDYDIIGSNVDGSDPAKNINPNTFCHRVINAYKSDQTNFEILPMCHAA